MEKNSNAIQVWENLIKAGIAFVFVVTITLMAVAVFDKNTEGEANIGSFAAEDFNDGWMLLSDGQEKEVSLPVSVDVEKGEEIVVEKTLPPDLSDGMSLMARARLEDLYIYVDGKLREQYSSDSIKGMSFYIPSAYVVCALNKEDSSKQVRLVYRVKAMGVTGAVYIGYGNNGWFGILKSGLPLNLMALGVLIIGCLLFIVFFFLKKVVFGARATRALSLLMVDIGMWILSESNIRQFIFRRPSMSCYFAYLTVEIIGALVCLYFDEVQHRNYHKRYILMETLVFIQLMINIIMNVTGVADFYQTLVFSHIWSGLCLPVAVASIISDIRKNRVKEYFITLIGMISFTVMAVCELLAFYINRMGGLGTFLCIGMLLLMTATILQSVYDEAQFHKERERKQTEMTINTIEIIASAIDARDEYTGGHSERVGLYASRLASRMAYEYGFTKEDILRIRYIGLVHDIGKIGVADNVLNKSGKLTAEEYSLMKKHSEIGYEIMSSLGEDIEGLLDGIRHHHERYDGKGYPDGLAGNDIPLIARILAIADSYDAMTSNRVYRKFLSEDEVRQEISRCAGTQFDPELAKLFLELIDKGEMKVKTENGVAVDESGRIRNSALLESRLQKDLLAKMDIVNPAHVRMLCYIMKLMEKQGKDYSVLFMGFDADNGEGHAPEWEN